MLLLHRQRKIRHKGSMLIDTWRMLETIQRFKAFASMQHFKGVVAPRSDTREHCTTGVSSTTLAESALPA
jgi:hypothetical protein